MVKGVQEGYMKIFRKGEGVPLSQIAKKSSKMLKGAHNRYSVLKKLSRMGTLSHVSRFSNNKVGQFGSAPSEIVRIVVEIIVAASFFGVVAFFL